MVKLAKGNLVGTLKVTQYEHVTSKGGQWRNCLALIDGSGNWISTVRFRPNAHKKALDYFIQDGWKVAIPKMEAYKAGLYKFKVPGICPNLWNDQDWINYISAYNGWTVPVQ